MTAEIRQLETHPGPGRVATPQLRTLVVCDIADSTALVERMGDQNAANIIRKHDRLARALIEQHQGREIDKTDGFLLLFDRPIQAAAFALDYQRGLKHMSAAEGVVVRARVGVHMGDVVIWENAPEDVARGAKPIEVEGLVKPVAARLAQLARPQQTLMSSAAAGIAHRAERELGAEAVPHVHWKNHGKYTFKGLPDALEVVEVGEDGVAPLHAPKSVRTAKRVLPWWRRPLTLAAEAAVLAIAVGVGGWLLLQSPPTLAFAARDWVVVGNVHNLTGDALFNQSVDTALRISLEQSQYVNVLPELSVRQTLQQMELNPDTTQVTRAIGSQVALRDGVRALILPTVAEVGGRVRVTAEVIDPNTQATVYSVSADGVGVKSVLPSLDSVSKQLRGKLGEALAMVSKTSVPLAQVTTSNLVALRTYSLGIHAKVVGKFKEAIAYLQQAVDMDPDFARARLELASIYYSTGQQTAAWKQFRRAAALGARLTERDKLMSQAWLALYDSPREALQKWAMLAKIYPDMYGASGKYGYFAWMFANDFITAKTAITRSASPHNPYRVNSVFMLGVLAVGQQQYPRAIQEFKAAQAEGYLGTVYASFAYAAQRQFGKASRVLAKVKSSGVAGDDMDGMAARIAIAVDRGDWIEAGKMLDTARRESKKLGPLQALRFDGIARGIDFLLPASSSTPDPEPVRPAPAVEATRWERAQFDYHRLWRAYLAARAGDIHKASGELAGVGKEAGTGDFPVLDNMLAIARAELAVAKGHASVAVALLQPLLTGREIYLTHVALMDAEKAAGHGRAALAQAHWLVSHRGRAYAEYSDAWMLTAFNVAQSNLALLDAAELSQTTGDVSSARTELAAFLKAWPEAAKLPALSIRIDALSKRLPGQAGNRDQLR